MFRYIFSTLATSNPNVATCANQLAVLAVRVTQISYPRSPNSSYILFPIRLIHQEALRIDSWDLPVNNIDAACVKSMIFRSVCLAWMILIYPNASAVELI